MHASVLFLAFATLATARTDLSGCVSSEVITNGGASYLWYVPGSGEICSFLDCGGGRAPPQTTVPGCPQYSGTATYSPSFIPGFRDASGAPSTTSGAAPTAPTASAPLTAMITSSPTMAVNAESTAAETDTSGSASVTTKASGSTNSIFNNSSSTLSGTAATTSSTRSSTTPNSGVDVLPQGILGAVAAGLAFLL